MKKTALLLVIVLLLSLSLSSCQVLWMVIEPKDANELWGKIEKKMDSLDSYKAEAVAIMSFEYSGLEIDGEMGMTVVFIGSNADNDSYFYDRSTMDIDMDGTTVTADELTVYEDGKMYLCRNSDDQYSRIYSKLSFEGFLDYYFDSEVDFDVSPDGAKNSSLERLSVNEWKLSYYGFEEDRLEEIMDQIDLDEFAEEMELEITDIFVELKTDKQYRISEITVEFVDESYDTPVISMTVSYGDFDSAERVEFDKSEYTEVDDARVAKWVSDYLDDVIYEERVEFTLNTEQSVTINATNDQTYSTSSVERDKVRFVNENEKFTYHVDAETEDQTISIDYKNGSQVIYVGGKKQTYIQQESDARNFIKELMNPMGFSIYAVKDIWKIGSEKYRIYLNVHDESPFESLAAAMKVLYRSCEVYFEVTMDGEDIESITTYITVKGSNNYVTASNPILNGTYTVEYVMTIESD